MVKINHSGILNGGMGMGAQSKAVVGRSGVGNGWTGAVITVGVALFTSIERFVSTILTTLPGYLIEYPFKQSWCRR